MKRLLLCLLMLACSASHPAPPPAPLRVLFVGNSLTYYNDMPARFARHVERTTGRKVTTAMVAPPGATLADHRASGEAMAAIRAQHWDFVVLQDRGGQASAMWRLDGVPHPSPPDAHVRDVGFLARAINATGARAVLYQTWGSSKAGFVYEDYGSALAARVGHALLATVGRAWWARADEQALLGPDGIHPTPLGSQLIAEVLAATMLGPPVPLVVPPRPSYPARPEVTAKEPIHLGQLAGTWRAIHGGTRLSLGTELEIHADGSMLVREYSLADRLELPVTDARVEGGVLELTVPSPGVSFAIRLALDGGSLRGLTLASNRPDYQRVTYVRDGEAASFARLESLYALREREEQQLGLAEALRRHFARLTEQLGPSVLGLTEGQPIDEWMVILAAWAHAEADEPRALAYFHAATELFPRSVDAALQLADALAQTGHPTESRAEYERARALDAASPGGPHAEVVQQIDAGLPR